MVALGPAQVSKGFIATLVLQDAMVRIFRYFYGLAHSSTIPIIPSTSQTEGKA